MVNVLDLEDSWKKVTTCVDLRRIAKFNLEFQKDFVLVRMCNGS